MKAIRPLRVKTSTPGCFCSDNNTCAPVPMPMSALVSTGVYGYAYDHAGTMLVSAGVYADASIISSNDTIGSPNQLKCIPTHFQPGWNWVGKHFD